MLKYAIDLTNGDRVMDKKTARTVFIDWIEPSMFDDSLAAYGYFEDNGEDWTRTLDHDSVMRIV